MARQGLISQACFNLLPINPCQAVSRIKPATSRCSQVPHAFVTEREARLDAHTKQDEADRQRQEQERRVSCLCRRCLSRGV